LRVEVERSLSAKHPGLLALMSSISDLTVRPSSIDLEKLKLEVVADVRARYTLEKLKDFPTIHAYREFFWRVGIDPTKVRPAAEALIRRILAGRAIPTINTLVDAYNLASIKTCIALAAFDDAKLHSPLLMRSAEAGEEFFGIGMNKPMSLKGGEIVITDNRRLIAVYPYRDADQSRVTSQTQSIILMVCGCPGIGEEALLDAEKSATELITRFCVDD
jgi:DNA/RNA-binding domain of Phe-tRNA-synthetase-like protein